jgi:hypothetical protein
MEHTNEFLQGMFAAYMGCEVIVENKPNSSNNWIGDKTCVLNAHILHIVSEGSFDIKLILTPLSETSDGDLIRILGWEHHKDIEIREKEVSIEGVFCSAFCTNSKGVPKAKGLTSSLIFDCLPLRHTDYLRSKKYDCGYLHISSLIQAGLAVKSTK